MTEEASTRLEACPFKDHAAAGQPIPLCLELPTFGLNMDCKEDKRKGSSRWMRLARRRLPILAWAPRYSRLAGAADAVAGVTLGLTLVPQSIAYAALAEVPVQYGLYSSFVGTILYMFLGTVKEVSIGPTSLMALLTLQACRGLPVEYVVLLTFLSGCVVLLMGLLRLGFLVELISVSVTSGFTSATAVVIVAAQLKGALGLSFTAESAFENIRQAALRWRQVRPGDCILAAVCCTTLLLLRKLKDVKVSSERVRRALWLVSIARNALVVLGASLFAYCTYDPDNLIVKLSGKVEPGFPRVSWPPFNAPGAGNETVPFPDMVRRLGPTVLMMPIVMVIANIAIAKAFTPGGRVDATQEMVALGLGNAAGALLHALPSCGAFTRSALAHASGVRTPAAGLYSGLITLLALVFMTKYFYFIPKACLSSVLICAVIFMIDVGIVKRLWRHRKGELVVLAATFATSVCATVELGVLCGVLADLALLLYSLMHPPTQLHTVKSGGCTAVVVAPGVGLLYVNAERVLAAAAAAAGAGAGARALLLDCAGVALIDYAAEQALERLAEKFKSKSQLFLPFNASEPVARRLARLRLDGRALRARSAADALATATATSPAPAPATSPALAEPAETAVLLGEP